MTTTGERPATSVRTGTDRMGPEQRAVSGKARLEQGRTFEAMEDRSSPHPIGSP
jgi:hypothetical protein